jgi:hypothetical protein
MRLWLSYLVFAAAVPSPQEATPRPAPAALSCSGPSDEWSLLLVGSRGELSVDSARVARFEGRYSIDDSTAFGWRGRSAGEGGDLVAFVREAACSTALGEEQPLSVNVSLPDGRFVSGCCRRLGDVPDDQRTERPVRRRPSPAPTPAPSLGDWISSLPTFLPAINECVTERNAAEAVVFAAIRPDRTTHLVLRLPEDRYADCLLPPGRGPAKVVLRPRGAPRSAEEQAALFSLLATPPPMEPCYRPQAVLDEQGERLGWIALKGC